MKYEVIDNFLSNEDADYIENFLMGNSFPWYYSKFIADNNEIKNQYYFVHPFYQDDKFVGDFSFLVIPILSKINYRSIVRIKANMFPRMDSNKAAGMHRDQDYSHMGVIYYVNSNDGYTEMSDGTKIESVKNRLLIFDAYDMHSSTFCTDVNTRVNINFNLL